ncbi:MAG TPA: hypothetical protein VJR92_05265 [Gemmatimonadaceae bacterium]|nr:hypothetical protein [Gemmatimonadaceae bacterium]
MSTAHAPVAALPSSSAIATDSSDVVCTTCSAAVTPEIRAALVTRITALRHRGGACEAYAGVLDRSLTAGLITIKPYMWRVGRSLTSGEGRPSGEMTLARDIDSLNVGVRSVDDVVHSIEHEAAHIALGVPSGSSVNELRVDNVVRDCRSTAN